MAYNPDTHLHTFMMEVTSSKRIPEKDFLSVHLDFLYSDGTVQFDEFGGLNFSFELKHADKLAIGKRIQLTFESKP